VYAENWKCWLFLNTTKDGPNSRLHDYVARKSFETDLFRFLFKRNCTWISMWYFMWKNKTKISDIQKLLKVSCRPTLYYDKQTELPFVCRKATKISTALSVVLRVGNASKGVSLGRHADVLLRKRYDDGLQTCWMIVFKVGWITECTVYIGLQYRINNGRQVWLSTFVARNSNNNYYYY